MKCAPPPYCRGPEFIHLIHRLIFKLVLPFLLALNLWQPCQAEPAALRDLSSSWRQLLRQLEKCTEKEQVTQVNTRVNQLLSFADDRSLWQRQDYWSTPAETLRKGKGDCEDYAILKYFTLRALGVAADKLWLTFAKARIGGPQSIVTIDHMVLAYYPAPNADPLILDSLVGSLYPASLRPDLELMLSFNNDAVYVDGQCHPATWLPPWRQLLTRMHKNQQGK